MSANLDTSSSVILGSDGEPMTIPTVMLSDEDARLLRDYKKFLLRHKLREALYCNDCWSGQKADGTEAHVTGENIMIRCRCKIRMHLGATY
jgi:hypothetical protein